MRRIKPHLFNENVPSINNNNKILAGNNGTNVHPPQNNNYGNNRWKNPQQNFAVKSASTAQKLLYPQVHMVTPNIKIIDSKSKDGIIICGFCKKLYHSVNTCWRYLGLCLICGKGHKVRDYPKFSPKGGKKGENHFNKGKNYKISQPSSDGFKKVFNKSNKGISPNGDKIGKFNVQVSNRYQALQDTIPKVWQPRGGRNGGGAWIHCKNCVSIYNTNETR
ncbi:unnamed protein product [Rotaria magnacalcarata]|uniref:Uncharacterized protein n=1 Tax=Rotaria magnacalcarata TaxID=392030 RepID=A0A816XUX6_9BILA|nr:unnamed protein product [Rotaria magnacalcarata]